MNQAYLQVRLNLILNYIQKSADGSFPKDLQEIERLAKYIVDGPAIQPIHGTIING